MLPSHHRTGNPPRTEERKRDMSGFFIEMIVTLNIIPITLIIVQRLTAPTFGEIGVKT